MINVTNEVPVYDNPAKSNVRVHSHWNDNNKVVLEVNGEKRDVQGTELISAIQNAMNTARY